VKGVDVQELAGHEAAVRFMALRPLALDITIAAAAAAAAPGGEPWYA